MPATCSLSQPLLQEAELPELQPHHITSRACTHISAAMQCSFCNVCLILTPVLQEMASPELQSLALEARKAAVLVKYMPLPSQQLPAVARTLSAAPTMQPWPARGSALAFMQVRLHTSHAHLAGALHNGFFSMQSAMDPNLACTFQSQLTVAVYPTPERVIARSFTSSRVTVNKPLQRFFIIIR